MEPAYNRASVNDTMVMGGGGKGDKIHLEAPWAIGGMGLGMSGYGDPIVKDVEGPSTRRCHVFREAHGIELQVCLILLPGEVF
jgi:hypothetical protein